VTDRNDHDRTPGDDILDGRFSRGGLLKGAAALGIGMSPLLAAACGGGSSSSTAASSSAGAPRRGGQLKLGFVGGGTAETLDPFIGVTPIDEGRIQNLYDPMVIVNPDLTTSPGLALEWNPNSDATVIIQSRSVTRAIRFHFVRFFIPTLRSSHTPPADMPSHCSNTRTIRTSSPRSHTSRTAGIRTSR